MSSIPTVALVGGSGFVGSALADYLIRDFRVKVVDVNPTRQDRVQFERCDICDKDALRSALQGVDVVINTAIVQIPAINEGKLRGYQVNVVGMQNVCEVVHNSDSIKGLLLASSWHVFEHANGGVIDDVFGLKMAKIERRATLYALSKIAQEAVARVFDEISEKAYCIVRLGTVLGENMPKQTAANIFIENAIQGRSMTVFKHTKYRPMLYVDILDVCRAFGSLACKILGGNIAKDDGTPIVNVMWPEPITIVELARIVRSSISQVTGDRNKPPILIQDMNLMPVYRPVDKSKLKVNISRAEDLLGTHDLTDPRKTISGIIARRLGIAVDRRGAGRAGHQRSSPRSH